LDLDGAVITADAMHTQVDTAEWIRDQGGHYVLTVKGNQKTLHRTLNGVRGISRTGGVFLPLSR